MTATLTDTPGSSEIPRAQRRYLLTTTVPLTVLIIVTTVWAVSASSEVPDPMASHFQGDGTADGFSSPVSNILFFAGLAGGILLLLTLLGRAGLNNGVAARTNAAAMGFSVTFACAIEYRMFEVQRGLTDAADANLDMLSELWLFGVAILVGGLLAAITRPVPDVLPALSGTRTPDRDTGVRVAWFGTSTMTTWVQLVVYGLVVGMLLWGILGSGSLISSVAYYGFLALLVLACTSWRYRVEAEGFTYRSALGVPRAKVPYDRIVAAELITVHPGEWGGWGYRFNGTGTGLITGRGPGIRIYRTNRKNIELNCRDAANGIAALEHHGVYIYDEDTLS